MESKDRVSDRQEQCLPLKEFSTKREWSADHIVFWAEFFDPCPLFYGKFVRVNCSNKPFRVVNGDMEDCFRSSSADNISIAKLTQRLSGT
ncbi:hypothetical protein AVEN_135508-1 [Araneus ventricosus]|uniref:Uncharacterized protein n=1 Tax=Araneus ventricosus TaxID=182803 RepID=A0A4Y2HPF1_ARAVE|nr:hypothetical protein AVEN_135508-1 [Araneus ventricosus]